MKETFDNYYKVLSTKSEEEEAIDREIDAENERFEATPEYIEHHEKVTGLYKKSHEAFVKRLDAAKEARPKRKKGLVIDLSKPKREKEPDSEDLSAAIDVVNKLTPQDKRLLWAKCFAEDVPVDEKLKVDDEIMDEFHHILVQTAIDFINEKKLKDVWSVSFYADSLQESAEFGMWCPATDSSLTLEALKKDEYPYRVEIGHSM